MAKFKIIDTISLPPTGKENEDGFILSDSFLCVLDGATPVKNIEYKGYSNLACWFVNRLKNSLILTKEERFIDKLQESIERIVSNDPLENISESDKPTSTISAAEIVGEKIHLYSLGDCSVFTLLKNGDIHRLYDNRVEKFSDRTFEQYLKALKMKTDTNSGIAKMKLTNIKSRNKPNGFWVVDYSNNFYQEIVNSHKMVNDTDKILLCSDGFSRLFDKHKIINIGDIFSGLLSLQQAYSLLREYEANHYMKDDFGYVKKHDDVTAILASILPN